ncbi:MAG: selenide, water dikinase SelD [Candidatus Nanopelagicales bacterium]
MLASPPRECGGCAAKAAPGLVAHVVRQARATHPRPDVMVGLVEADDAAVQRLDAERALVTTIDGFPPPISDPSDYGAIVAANAVADVYAMGAEVASALCFLAFPRDTDPAYLADIIRSAAEVVEESGGNVVGGHTVHSASPIFSMSVTGIVHPQRIWRAQGARPGDALVVSKPIGTGVAVSAQQSGSFESAIAIMRATVREDAQQLQGLPRQPSAVTDVSGYGLLGHLKEMTLGGGISMHVDASTIPVAPGATRLLERGHRTTAHATNLSFVSDDLMHAVDDVTLALLTDPQTSGGLLAAIDPEYIPLNFTRIGTVASATANEATLVVH